MRRWFFLAIGVFIVGGFILVWSFPEKENTVELLTVAKPYARVITNQDETISIPVYFSSTDSFLLEPEAIDKASIQTDTTQLSVTILAIQEKNHQEKYMGQLYNEFQYEIGFDYQMNSEEVFSLKQAILSITYINGETIELKIGDLYLMFHEVAYNEHLELYRMFAMTQVFNGLEYTSGVVIGLNNLTDSSIQITSMTNLVSGIQFDLIDAILVDDSIDIHTPMEEILQNEFDLSPSNQYGSAIEVVNDHLLLVPLQYEALVQVGRFPVVITYQYQNQTYQYLIDDFMFYQTNRSLEDENGNIRQCIYQYS